MPVKALPSFFFLIYWVSLVVVVVGSAFALKASHHLCNGIALIGKQLSRNGSDMPPTCLSPPPPHPWCLSAAVRLNKCVTSRCSFVFLLFYLCCRRATEKAAYLFYGQWGCKRTSFLIHLQLFLFFNTVTANGYVDCLIGCTNQSLDRIQPVRPFIHFRIVEMN